MSLVDLTLELGDGIHTYPGGPKMSIMDRITHEWTAGRYLPPAFSAMDRILLFTEHTGTHVDAPYHFLKEGASIDRLGLDRFVGEAIVADVSTREPSTPITQTQIEAALSAASLTLRHDDILLVHSWAKGREEPGFVTARAFAPDVGEWLVRQGIKAVGIDLASVDDPGDRSFPVHIALLSAGIPIYENLDHLDLVSGQRVTFVGLPLRVAGGGGSTVRAVAMTKEPGK
jgi:arylformamidase